MFVNIYFTCDAIIKNVNPPNTLYSFLLHPIRNKKYLLQKKKDGRSELAVFFHALLNLRISPDFQE